MKNKIVLAIGVAMIVCAALGWIHSTKVELEWLGVGVAFGAGLL